MFKKHVISLLLSILVMFALPVMSDDVTADNPTFIEVFDCKACHTNAILVEVETPYNVTGENTQPIKQNRQRRKWRRLKNIVSLHSHINIPFEVGWQSS